MNVNDILPIPSAADILGEAPTPTVQPTITPEVVSPKGDEVIIPPAVIEDGAAPGAPVDLKDWKPGKVDLKADPNKAPEKKPDDIVTPVEAPIENEGIARLRENYTTAKARAAELEARTAELEAIKAQQEADMQAMRAETEKLRLKASEVDPWQHPDVQAIVAPVNEDISKLPARLKMGKEELRNFNQTNISALTNEFMGIGSPESNGYEDRRYGFNERLQDLFPENSTSVRDAIVKSAEAAERAIEKMNALQANGMVSSFNEVKERHQDQVKRFEETIEKGMFEVSPEFAQADPFHPMSAIHSMIASSPAVAKISEDVKGILKKAAIPPAPISPEELEKMTPESREAVLTQRNLDHKQTVESLMKIQGPALVAYQLFGVIYKKWREAEDRLATIAGEIPGGRSTPPGKPGDSKVDIKAWSPPPIPKL